MSVSHDLIIDQLSPAADRDQHLATWYTQGHSDGLGDRLLMFDNTSAPSWEILRFKPSLARDERFEAGLRRSVEQLSGFHHPAFPLVRPLKGLGHEDGLAVVSTYSPGLPLSEAMKRPRSAAFAVRLLRQLAPALAALQQHAGGALFHGALDIDRVVVTANGRLTIREHMVGAALASLELSTATLWSDFRILAGPTYGQSPKLDARADVVQLGVIVLSLMAGRRIGPDDYPDKVERLLDEIADRNGRQALGFFQSLRYWIERALQLDDYMFESAGDANDALAELRDEADHADDFAASVAATLPEPPQPEHVLTEGPWPKARPRPHLISATRVEADESVDPSPLSDSAVAELRVEPAAPASESRTNLPPRFGRPVHWIAAAVAAVAIAEGIFIGRVLFAPAPIAPPTPPVANIDSPARLLPTVGVAQDARALDAPAPESKGTTLKVASALTAPSASQRNGGFRLSSPFEVHVLDNDRVLGSSTDGPIVAAAGRHEFDFVNSGLGFRVHRVVEIKAGQIASVTVPLPNGTLNINAVPWAAVWIDGNSAGETPLGNLSIPIGEHEIVFRHPQFGERREKTVVRADGATRVTMNMQR